MRKTVLTIFLAWVCLALYGQDKPLWLDNDTRVVQFPSSAYFTGYAEGNINADETAEKAIERIKSTAQSNLLESVRVNMQSQTNANTEARTTNNSYNEIETFTNQMSKNATAEITGMKVDSYFDKNENYIYAFAYVNKYELQVFYQKQITLWLNKVEGALKTATELLEKGYKMKAKKQCESVVEAFVNVFYAQDLLTAIDENANETSLQQSRSEQLRNTLVQTIIDLENSVYVYIECKETVNGQSVIHIGNRLPGLITEKGCSCNFTDSQEEADYIITINAHLTRCNDAPDNVVFCYATATVSLYNVHTQKTLKPKINDAKGGWTAKNYAKATEEAFNELAEKIVKKITTAIND